MGRYVLKYETGNAGRLLVTLEGGRLLPSIYLSIDWPLSEMRGRLPWGVELSDCHQHRPDQPVIPKGLSLPLSLSTKFYITRSNASDERKHYPRFSTIYTLVWIHNKLV